MTRNKTIKAALVVVTIVALVVGGEGARRPKLATRNETAAAVL